MKAQAPALADADRSPALVDAGQATRERLEDELIMDLERDQFVVETSRPVPPALLSARATAALWALRVFVILVSLMVIYTFFYQLR